MNIHSKLIDYFGGQNATAKALKCTQPSVHAWVKGTAKMSAILAMRAEKITNGEFKAKDLCPELAEIENLPSANDEIYDIKG